MYRFRLESNLALLLVLTLIACSGCASVVDSFIKSNTTLDELGANKDKANAITFTFNAANYELEAVKESFSVFFDNEVSGCLEKGNPYYTIRGNIYPQAYNGPGCRVDENQWASHQWVHVLRLDFLKEDDQIKMIAYRIKKATPIGEDASIMESVNSKDRSLHFMLVGDFFKKYAEASGINEYEFSVSNYEGRSAELIPTPGLRTLPGQR